MPLLVVEVETVKPLIRRFIRRPTVMEGRRGFGRRHHPTSHPPAPDPREIAPAPAVIERGQSPLCLLPPRLGSRKMSARGLRLARPCRVEPSGSAFAAYGCCRGIVI